MTLQVPQSRVPMTLVVLLRMIYFCFCTTPFFSGVWPLWPQQWPCRICYWCSQLWAELSFSLLLTRLLTLLADFAVVGELLWWPQYCQIYLYKMVMTLLSYSPVVIFIYFINKYSFNYSYNCSQKVFYICPHE